MARVLIDNLMPAVKGAGLVLTMRLTFYGSDVASGGDGTVIEVPLSSAKSRLTWREEIKTAIAAEATRLGYGYDGDALLLAALVVGL